MSRERIRKALKDIELDDIGDLEDSIIPRKKDYSTGRVHFPIQVVDVFGAGANAAVFKIVDTKGHVFAMRVGDMEEATFILQKELAAREMAPSIYHVGVVKDTDVPFTIMERILGTLDDYLEGKFNAPDVMTVLSCLLDMKTKLRMVHGDMHTGNIAILRDRKTLGFIDLEFTFIAPTEATTIVDFIPLLATLRGYRFAALRAGIEEYYRKTFNVNIKAEDIRNKYAKGEFAGFDYKGLQSYVLDEADVAHLERKVKKVFPTLEVSRILPVKCDATLA